MASRFMLLCLILVVSVTASCGSSSDSGPSTQSNTPPPPSPPPEQPVTPTANPATQIASLIYDVVDNGQSATEPLQSIFEGLGIPVLPLAQAGVVEQALNTSNPVAFDLQLALLDRAFSTQHFVTLNSFFAAFNAAGIKGTNPLQPFTKDYLTERLRYLVNKPVLEREEVLPALVLALGRERAKRHGPSAENDAVWGDQFLDPLQYELLLYALMFAGTTADTSATPTTFAASALKRYALISPGPAEVGEISRDINKILKYVQGGAEDKFKVVRGLLEAIISKEAGLIITSNPVKATRLTVCSSIYLYSYKISPIGASPDEVWRPHPQAPSLPHISSLSARLIFDFVPHGPSFSEEANKGLLEFFCGKLPEYGPVTGKTIKWDIVTHPSPSILKHGFITPKESVTASDGISKVEYIANPEKAKYIHEDYQHYVTAYITAGAVGLLENLDTLEWIVREIRTNPEAHIRGGVPGFAETRLRVNYYADDGVWEGTSTVTLTGDDGIRITAKVTNIVWEPAESDNPDLVRLKLNPGANISWDVFSPLKSEKSCQTGPMTSVGSLTLGADPSSEWDFIDINVKTPPPYSYVGRGGNPPISHPTVTYVVPGCGSVDGPLFTPGWFRTLEEIGYRSLIKNEKSSGPRFHVPVMEDTVTVADGSGSITYKWRFVLKRDGDK